MKSRRFLSVPFVIGLSVGLLALYAAASPIGTAGDLVTGGWTWCYTADEGVPIGMDWVPSSRDCGPCSGTYTRNCSEGWGSPSGNCTGATIVIAVYNAGGATAHPTGSRPVCYNPPGYPNLGCENIFNATCY